MLCVASSIKKDPLRQAVHILARGFIEEYKLQDEQYL